MDLRDLFVDGVATQDATQVPLRKVNAGEDRNSPLGREEQFVCLVKGVQILRRGKAEREG